MLACRPDELTFGLRAIRRYLDRYPSLLVVISIVSPGPNIELQTCAPMRHSNASFAFGNLDLSTSNYTIGFQNQHSCPETESEISDWMERHRMLSRGSLHPYDAFQITNKVRPREGGIWEKRGSKLLGEGAYGLARLVPSK